MKFNVRYKSELPLWLRLLGAWRVNADSIDFNWGYFAPQFGLEFIVQRGSYFYQNYGIIFTLGWGTFKIKLPFKTSLPEGCSMPQYGFAVRDSSLWIHTGGNYDHALGQVVSGGLISWDIPFFSKYWVKTETLSNDMKFIDDKEKTKDPFIMELPYRYRLQSGEVQNVTATCIVKRMTHARKWLPFIKTVWDHIDIEFSDEIGERSGSWKGGCIGCSWTVLPNESIPDALYRMQQERKF